MPTTGLAVCVRANYTAALCVRNNFSVCWLLRRYNYASTGSQFGWTRSESESTHGMSQTHVVHLHQVQFNNLYDVNVANVAEIYVAVLMIVALKFME